jgi:hypothetical protein
MTMYLPNDDLRPTGSEVAEFIDGPSVAEDVATPAGPAGVAPASIAKAVTHSDAARTTPAVPVDAQTDGHVVAHLRNVRTGEVALYAGERKITVRDRHLAALLFHASR